MIILSFFWCLTLVHTVILLPAMPAQQFHCLGILLQSLLVVFFLFNVLCLLLSASASAQSLCRASITGSYSYCIGVRAGGTRGAAAPPVLKIFGQNAYDSGKSTWDKLFIESSFYNTTKWSILKRLNGSVCCRALDAGICCSFAPNFLANSQKAVERVRFVKSLLFK